MADILYRVNQASSLVESNANIETVTKAIGWVANIKSLNVVEDVGLPIGSASPTYQVSSTVGPGQGRRINKAGHGFTEGQAVKLSVESGIATWVLALATLDGSKSATHIVTNIINDGTFDVSSNGAWSLSSVMNAGVYYLSDTVPGLITTVAPASAKQVVGICDGSSLFLTFGGSGGSSYDRVAYKGTFDPLKQYTTNDAVTYGPGLYIATNQMPVGTLPAVTSVWTLLATKFLIPSNAPILSTDSAGNTVVGMILDESGTAYPSVDVGQGAQAVKIAVRVGLDVPASVFADVTDVVTSGRLALAFKTQSAKTFFAGPTTGTAAAPAFRAIVQTDIGSGTPDATNWLRGDGAWAAITAAAVGGLAAIATSGSASDLTVGTVPAARMPALTGDVTSTAGTVATAIASTVVTSKVLTGYAVGANSAIAATDSILVAFQKIQGQISARQDTTTSQAVNTVYAAPSAAAGAPSFRLLVAADIPVHDAAKITTGILGTARLGSGTASSSVWLRGDSTWTAITAAAVGGLAAIATSGSATDLIAGTVPAARFPALTGDVTSTAGTVATSIAATVVTAKVLTGYAVGTNTAILATDTILAAFQKLQGQVSSRQDTSVSQAVNTVYAAPSGAAGAPSFRLLVAADLPVHDASKITTGVFDVARMPALTGDVTSTAGTTTTAIAATVVTGKVLTGYVAGANSAIAATDTILAAFQKLQGQITARTDSSVSQAANLVYASPSGTTGVPSFRALVALDIPVHDASKITTGTMAAARLGSGTPTSSTFLRGDNSWSVLNATDIPSLDWTKITTGKPTTLAGYGIAATDTLFDAKYILVSSYNQANGTPRLDSNGLIPNSLLQASVLGKVEYIGTWNASTNTPTLPAAATSKGWYYIVTTAGTYNSIDFNVNDWVICNGTTWDKIDNTDAVTSVFGRTGAVVATAADYTAFYPLLSGSYSNPAWITALDGSKITTGTVAAARLGSGTPTALNWLRGDGAWTAITAAAVGGLATIATSGSASDLVAGTVPAARMPALTGDVTTTAGTIATSLASIITAGGPTGSASVVPVITWDAKGRLTAVSTATITPAAIGAPTLAGVGATGTWGISISGNAATATTATTATTANGVTWANVTSKPAGMDANGAHRLYRAEDASLYWAEISWVVGAWCGNSWFMTSKNSQSDSQTNISTVRVDFANIANVANSATYATSAGSTTGNSATASKLATAQTIAMTGDGSWSVSFDGSTGVSAAMTLANTGVVAGTYKSVTVNAKGLVTAGTNPTTLAGYGISVSDTLFDPKYGRLAVANAWIGTNDFSNTVSVKSGQDLNIYNWDNSHHVTMEVSISSFVEPGAAASSYDDSERMIISYDGTRSMEIDDYGIRMRNHDILGVKDLQAYNTIDVGGSVFVASNSSKDPSMLKVGWGYGTTYKDQFSCSVWNSMYTSYFGKDLPASTAFPFAGMSVYSSTVVSLTTGAAGASGATVNLSLANVPKFTVSAAGCTSIAPLLIQDKITTDVSYNSGALHIYPTGDLAMSSPTNINIGAGGAFSVGVAGNISFSNGGTITIGGSGSVNIAGSNSDHLSVVKSTFANAHTDITCMINNQRTMIATGELIIRAPIVYDATILTGNMNYLPQASTQKIGTTYAFIGNANGAPISIYLMPYSGDVLRYRTTTGATSQAVDNMMSIDGRFVLATCVSSTTWQCSWY